MASPVDNQEPPLIRRAREEYESRPGVAAARRMRVVRSAQAAEQQRREEGHRRMLDLAKQMYEVAVTHGLVENQYLYEVVLNVDATRSSIEVIGQDASQTPPPARRNRLFDDTTQVHFRNWSQQIPDPNEPLMTLPLPDEPIGSLGDWVDVSHLGMDMEEERTVFTLGRSAGRDAQQVETPERASSPGPQAAASVADDRSPKTKELEAMIE